MILTKEDFNYYLDEDRKALGHCRRRPLLYGDEIWKFQRYLRLIEYLNNVPKGNIFKLLSLWAKFRKRQLAFKLGYEISPNTFGPGLAIVHRGPIIILDKVRIGANCRIHSCVNIGSTKGTGIGAKIGNNCYIGPGVQIVGPVQIADNITIGAGSVVTKSFDIPNVIIAGVPARVIKKKSSVDLVAEKTTSLKK
jgi:serine O-acetyltransferase